MDTKICITCKQNKPLSEYSIDKTRKSKKQNKCVECAKDYAKDYYKRKLDLRKSKDKVRRTRGRQLLWDYLLEHPCVDCGESDPLFLDFDHLENKKSNVSKLILCRKKTLVEEILKCEVRCVRCHRIKNQMEQNWYDGLVRSGKYLGWFEEFISQ